MEAMLKQFSPESAGERRAAAGPLDRYEEEQAQREGEASGPADFVRAQSEMMQAGLAAFQAGTAAWQQAMGEVVKAAGGAAGPRNGKRPEGEPTGRDIFGEMFEPGLRLSEAYQREMEAMLDRLRPAAKRG
jgi:hypothetical protein